MSIYSFEPVIDQNSKLIILGSMPGAESLRKQEYYANPRNQFWYIVYSLFEMDMAAPYIERLRFLKANRIALWDVLASCDRQGSLDSDIKNPVVNDFNKLFQEYSSLKYIFFNGTKAAGLFQKHVSIRLPVLFEKTLPSTSPARAISLKDKKTEWAIIKDCCVCRGLENVVPIGEA